MAVAFDASAESHTTGTTGSVSQASFSWTHAPVGTPAGILVFVFTNANTALISSVTYGGTSMNAVSGGMAADTTTEPGRCTAYFLGSSIPTGNQTVQVNRTNNTTAMYAVSVSVTADRNTEAVGPVLLQNDGTLAEQNVDDGSLGTNSVRFAGINSGLGTAPSAGANSTIMQTFAYSARSVSTVRETTAGQGSRPVGFSSGTSDDRAAVHLAVREVAPTRYVFVT